MDHLDQAILRILQGDGRISNVELARRINLSPPATLTRVKALEEQGIIRGYTALLDAEALGFELLCFIQVGLQLHQPEQVNSVREAIGDIPQVLECHHVTGDYDYLLKVVARGRKDLEKFILEQLTPIRGIARIQTSLVLTEVKSTSILPVG
jgi:DNA-binding Lrp family transcriptional regulator